jgi:hypothetical protein
MPEHSPEPWEQVGCLCNLIHHEASVDIAPWVEEGRRVGKAPWCCSSVIEDRVADALAAEGISERETAEETIARRKAENHLTTTRHLRFFRGESR